MPEISGLEAEQLIRSQLIAHGDGVLAHLSQFDPETTFERWLDTVRAIEEFINLPLFTVGDDELKRTIADIRLDVLDMRKVARVVKALTRRYGPDLAGRFELTLSQSIELRSIFKGMGRHDLVAHLETVQSAGQYFQSRRRHLVALLYTIPSACTGSRHMGRRSTVRHILPLVEHCCLTITGLHQKLMLYMVFPDFKLILDAKGFDANYSYDPLESFSSEPERLSLVDATSATTVVPTDLEDLDPRCLFSAAEVRNSIKQFEAAYFEFNLSKSDFSPMAALVRECLKHCNDDYLIRMSVDQFTGIADALGVSPTMRKQFVHRSGDYATNLNVFSPLIEAGGAIVGTVLLMIRFLYWWKSTVLNRQRRFQIRSGYLLEDKVKSTLSEQGFQVSDIKRINRKEFDVVAVLNDVIYNIQCKNNLVDLSRMERDVGGFARYNRYLDRYYAAALVKEERRENLLTQALGKTDIKHIVLTRFPVATSNPRVVAYRQLEQLRTIAEAM